MYKQCTTERSAEQQRRIEKELLRQMGQTSYDRVSVSRLCEETGLSRKTFYRLFGNKDDVLLALVDHTLTDSGDFLTNESLPRGKEEALIQFLEFWKAKEDVLTALCREQKSALLVQRTLEHIIREEWDVLRAMNYLGTRKSYDVLLFYVSGILSMVIAWHNDHYSTPVAELARLMGKLIRTAGTLQET